MQTAAAIASSLAKNLRSKNVMTAEGEENSGNKLKVLIDGDGMRTLMSVYNDYVSEEEYANFLEFAREVDDLLYRHRGNRPLTREEKEVMNEGGSKKKSSKPRIKRKPKPQVEEGAAAPQAPQQMALQPVTASDKKVILDPKLMRKAERMASDISQKEDNSYIVAVIKDGKKQYVRRDRSGTFLDDKQHKAWKFPKADAEKVAKEHNGKLVPLKPVATKAGPGKLITEKEVLQRAAQTVEAFDKDDFAETVEDKLRKELRDLLLGSLGSKAEVNKAISKISLERLATQIAGEFARYADKDQDRRMAASEAPDDLQDKIQELLNRELKKLELEGLGGTLSKENDPPSRPDNKGFKHISDGLGQSIMDDLWMTFEGKRDDYNKQTGNWTPHHKEQLKRVLNVAKGGKDPHYKLMNSDAINTKRVAIANCLAQTVGR